jgi:hypothetical protein
MTHFIRNITQTDSLTNYLSPYLEFTRHFAGYKTHTTETRLTALSKKSRDRNFSLVHSNTFNMPYNEEE